MSMNGRTRPTQAVSVEDAERDWLLDSERDVELGSLQWVLREAGVRSDQPSPLTVSPAPALYDGKVLDCMVKETLADRLTERLTCPRPNEVVHKSGQLVGDGACCAAIPSLWTVLVTSVVDGVVDPFCSWCSNGPSEAAPRLSDRACTEAEGHTGRAEEDTEGSQDPAGGLTPPRGDALLGAHSAHEGASTAEYVNTPLGSAASAGRALAQARLVQASAQRSGEPTTVEPNLRSLSVVGGTLAPIVALQRKHQWNHDEIRSAA